MSEWRNRITEVRTVKAEELRANQDNWRVHPGHQATAIRGVLAQVGIVAPLIAYYSERAGGALTLIDGHMRHETGGEWPCTILDVNDAEADFILSTYDPVGDLAEMDTKKLMGLLKRVDKHPVENEAAQQTLKDLAGMGEGEAEQAQETEIRRQDVPDAVFATDNDFDIPLLDLSLQAEFLDLPLTRWGEIGRTSKMRGTYHFYTDDYKFDALWADPSNVVNSACKNVVEPNFSTNEQMPFAVGLWGIYRKRWLARYWQMQGIRVFVDLNVSPKFRDFNFFGVPRGWAAYMTRSIEGLGMGLIEDDYARCVQVAGGDPLFVVYGGGKATAEHCKGRGWLWIPENMHVKDGRVKEGVYHG